MAKKDEDGRSSKQADAFLKKDQQRSEKLQQDRTDALERWTKANANTYKKSAEKLNAAAESGIKAMQAKEKADALEVANRERMAASRGVSLAQFEKTMDATMKEGWSATEGVFEPLDELGKSMGKIQVDGTMGKSLGSASGAIKELTGGLLDLGEMTGDAMDKVKAVGTLIATPFKVANNAIAGATKFFGKEFNPGQKMADWWGGTETLIEDGDKKATKGFRDLKFSEKMGRIFRPFSQGAEDAKDKSEEGGSKVSQAGGILSAAGGDIEDGSAEVPKAGSRLSKAGSKLADGFNSSMEKLSDLGGRMKESAKAMGAATIAWIKNFPAMMKGLWGTIKQMGKSAAAFLMALPALIISSIAFVAGLIASAVSMMIAAAPIIGIALLIGLAVAALVMGIMFLVQNFESIKTTISEKITAMIDKVKAVVGNIADFFSNIWQDISDFIREKVLKIKSILGLTSDAEEEELKGIEERKAKKQALTDEANKQAEAEIDEMRANGELEGMSRREIRKLTKEKEAEALERVQEEAEFQAKSDEELMAEKHEADAQIKKLDEDLALREYDRKQDERLFKQATMSDLHEAGVDTEDLIEDGGKAKFMQFRQDQSDADHGTEDDILIEKSIQQFKADRAEAELKTRDDYIASKELTEEEKDAAHAKELGVSMEEYNAMQTTDADRELAHMEANYDEGVGEVTGDDYQSSFRDERAAAADRADGDRLKDARDEAEQQKYLSDLNTYGAGGSYIPPMNAVAVQNNSASNMVRMQDPSTTNPEPTGTRLSVVPA